MIKILILTPKSIAGKLIMESFASAFESHNCLVKIKAVEELSAADLEFFKPTSIFGYDYSYLMDEECTRLIEKAACKNHFFYFADEPQSKFATGDKSGLYQKLKQIEAKIFIWDKDFKAEFQDCYYLPLAADPFKYAMSFETYKHTISFVGRPLTKKRQEILCEVVKVFKNKLNIFCLEKHFLQSIEEIKEQNLLEGAELEAYSNCWKGFITEEASLAEVYNSSKINLNITEQGKSSLNYRVFEVLASGGFLITDERADLETLFEENKFFETYKDSTDLIDKIEFYLQNLNIAQKMAQLGRFKCIENHSFYSRAKIILNHIK